MANDKKQDGLFHWNFDLQDSDSDFTDIDYSADAISVSEHGGDEEKEIKPMIFVDGNYKSSSSYPEEEESISDTPGSFSHYKKSAARREKAGGRKTGPNDYYEDQERFAGTKRNIPWKPIIIGGAIALLALLGLILILAGRDGRKKVWAMNEDKEIDQLVSNYFKAKTEANATAMEKILTPGTAVNSLQMIMEAKAYESYDDIRVYSYPGMKKTDTALFVTYNSKFKNIDTKLPTIAWFYAKPDAEKNLRLMPVVRDESAKTQSAEYDYILGTYEGSPVAQIADEVRAANQRAVSSDPILAKYLDQIAKGNYETYVPETTTTQAPTTTRPTTTTAAPAPSGPVGYITEDNVRMRSSMDTTDTSNVITAFPAGHALEIVEELDGWVKVRDVLTQNKDGNTQVPTGEEGYVSALFFSK